MIFSNLEPNQITFKTENVEFGDQGIIYLPELRSNRCPTNCLFILSCILIGKQWGNHYPRGSLAFLKLCKLVVMVKPSLKRGDKTRSCVGGWQMRDLIKCGRRGVGSGKGMCELRQGDVWAQVRRRVGSSGDRCRYTSSWRCGFRESMNSCERRRIFRWERCGIK